MDYEIASNSDLPITGNTIVTNEVYLVFILLSILFALSLAFFIFFRKAKLFKKFRIRFLIVLTCVAIILLSSSLYIAYWTISETKINDSNPTKDSRSVSIRKDKIEIFFDKPVDRVKLEKYITPEIPGSWKFEDKIFGTNFYRKIVFYPNITFSPDTEYTVTLLNISGYFNKVPKAYSYTFKTQNSPNILMITPGDNTQSVEPNTSIEIALDAPNDGISEFDFDIIPSHPIDIHYDANSLKYIITPKTSFAQGTQYALVARKTNLKYQLPSNTVSEREATSIVHESTFTTAETPGINYFAPKGDKVFVNTPIAIEFSESMNRQSVEENFSITPNTFGSFAWVGNTMTFKPFGVKHDTEYRIIIPKTTKSAAGGVMEVDIIKSFKTIGAARVSSIYPQDAWTAVSADSPIQVTFDQQVDRQSAQDSFSIEPEVSGDFEWNGNTMIFKPDSPFEFSRNYQVTLATGIQSIYGLPSSEDYVSTFTTQAQTVKLDVPLYYQKYTLSCEAAALKMTLEYKGVSKTEDALIAEIGFDNTPRSGGIWGDPHSAFVGNVNGTQNVNGYGVYWEPIARVARNYRNAREFTNGNLTEVLRQVEAGNPVIAWTYIINGTRYSWKTPEGKQINAVWGEHTAVVVGFVGNAEEPTHIILNDPYLGQVYWERSLFEERWSALGNSGVIIY